MAKKKPPRRSTATKQALIEAKKAKETLKREKIRRAIAKHNKIIATYKKAIAECHFKAQKHIDIIKRLQARLK